MARPVSNDDFDERFLLAWGLGETAGTQRSDSEVAREGRQKLLAKQARESPWWVVSAQGGPPHTNNIVA